MAAPSRRERLFAAALGLSLLFHGAVLLAPAWEVPLHQAPVVIEASLRRTPAKPSSVVEPVAEAAPMPPAPAPAAKAPRSAKPASRVGKPRRVISTPAAAPVTVASSDVTPAPEASGPVGDGGTSVAAAGPKVQAERTPAPERPPVSLDASATEPWPKQGEIRYQVRYGETVQVGEMVHRWSHDGTHYRMSEETRTVGLARLLRKFEWKKESEGWVGREGLAPTRFSEDLNGKRSAARMDWTNRLVVLEQGGQARERALATVTQDILSLAHHLAFLPDSQESVSLLVVAGRWAADATLSQIANERLRVPWGEVETRHFRCEARNGEYLIDVWLSREHRNAPVRVRVEDRKQGYVGDEIATELTLDGVRYRFRLTPEEEEFYKG